MSAFLPFKTYDDIPPLDRDYVLYVAEVKKIEEIPLDDINGLFIMLSEAEAKELSYDAHLHEPIFRP